MRKAYPIILIVFTLTLALGFMRWTVSDVTAAPADVVNTQHSGAVPTACTATVLELAQTFATVQLAIDAASSGDTINVAGICTGVETVNGLDQVAYINKSLTIQRDLSQGGDLGVLDANEMGRVFVLTGSGIDVTLRNLIIQNGRALGGDPGPFFDHGGGLYVDVGVNLIIETSMITGNVAANLGGSINSHGNVTIRDTIVRHNQAYYGGGIMSQSALTIENGYVHNNQAVFGGGINASGTLAVYDGYIAGNTAESPGSGASTGGGGLNVSGHATIENTFIMSNIIVQNGGTDVGGGGISASGFVTITDSIVQGNSGHIGGGIRQTGNSLHVANSTLAGNSATSGGAIYSDPGSTVTVLDSTIDSNVASSSGGGIYTVGGTTAIHGSTIVLNLATGGGAAGNGGGVFANVGGAVTIRNSTLVSNRAQRGGGVANGASTITVTNSTLSDNLAATNALGGGLYNDSGTAIVINSIVANSRSASEPVGSDCDSVGNNPTISYSIIEDGGCDAASGVGNITMDDPMLGTLADNGGATETLALLPDSPAIDTADKSQCPDTDQRGVARIGKCDMGAFEVEVECAPEMLVDHIELFDFAVACFNAQLFGQFAISVTGNLMRTEEPVAIDNVSSAELTILGGGSHVLDGSNQFRGFDILNGNVTVDGLTIQHGIAVGEGGGGIRKRGDGDLTVLNSTFEGNYAAYGAGIAMRGGGALTVIGSTFSDNYAEQDGGGIDSGTGGTVTVDNSRFESNIAASDGGGMYLGGIGSVELLNSEFAGNEAGWSGAGITNRNDGLTIENTSFEYNNASAARGGGVYNTGIVLLSDSTLSSNIAERGGAVFNSGSGTMLIRRTTINANIAELGAGILNYGAMAVRSSTLAENTTAEAGGGAGTFRGGGIYNSGEFNGIGALEVSFSTLSRNAAEFGQGGGIYNHATATVEIKNSTLFGNNTSGNGDGGGGIYSDGTTVVHDSIVAINTLGLDCAGSQAPTFTDSLDSDNSCGGGGTMSAEFIDPVLRDNGGATWTHALVLPLDRSTNPAMNTANNATCPATDQRGYLRHDGACDIGAYEYVGNIEATCAATFSSGPTTHYSLDASAVMSATQDAATSDRSTGPVVKIAGTCVGVMPAVTTNGTISQTVYIDQSMTLQGGHTASDWNVAPNRELRPTVLDANGQGRVLMLHDASASDNMQVMLSDLTLQNGLAEVIVLPFRANGGGVWVDQDVHLTILNSMIADNSAFIGGGILNSGGMVEIHDSVLTGNSAGPIGGGYFGTEMRDPVTNVTRGGVTTFTGSTISGNTASIGAGLAISFRSRATINETAISNNLATQGGAMLNAGNTLLNNSSLASNSARQWGGGIYNTGWVTITNSTLMTNTAPLGGGIYHETTTTTGGLMIENSTLSSNSASENGGGIYLIDGSEASLNNSTLWDNTAMIKGGGIYANHELQPRSAAGLSPAVVINNSIIGGSSGDNCASLRDEVEDLFDTTFTLVDAVSCGAAHNVSGNFVSTNLGLLDLQDNGGPTWTHAIISASDAVNRGDSNTCTVTDQRGYLRNDCDMGAFEFSGVPTAVQFKGMGSATADQPLHLKSAVLLVVVTLLVRWRHGYGKRSL